MSFAFIDYSLAYALNTPKAEQSRYFPSATENLAATVKPASSRCASAIQIVRPLESTAVTQARTPTGFAEIVRNYFPVPHSIGSILIIGPAQPTVRDKHGAAASDTCIAGTGRRSGKPF